MVKQAKLTLLVFENDWCAQCYTQRPIIRALSKKYSSKIDVQLIKIQDNPELAEQYQLFSAPSMVLLVNGQVVERVTRFIDANQLNTLVRYYM